MRALWRAVLALSLAVAWMIGLLGPAAGTWAAPGLCVGPVCGDEITRSAKHHWQLRLKIHDQQGRWERLVVDCRSGRISPQLGSVDRSYAGALVRRACRLAGENPG